MDVEGEAMNRYETLALGLLVGMLTGHLLTQLNETWRRR